MDQLGDALGVELLDSEKLKLIQDRIKYLTENPPTMICVNVVLSGTAALKHLICKEIIMGSTGISESDADWYILRSGAERELERLAVVGTNIDVQ